MKKITFKLLKKVKLLNSKNSSFFLKKKITNSSNKFNVQIANNANITFTTKSKEKSFDRWVSLYIPSQEANLLPPVGPFLGQHGFNTQQFCESFNLLTKSFPKGLPIWTKIKLFSDKSILFWLETPPTSFMLYSCFALNNEISYLDIFKIMMIKKIDLLNKSNYSIFSSVIGTSRSMSFYLK